MAKKMKRILAGASGLMMAAGALMVSGVLTPAEAL